MLSNNNMHLCPEMRKVNSCFIISESHPDGTLYTLWFHRSYSPILFSTPSKQGSIKHVCRSTENQGLNTMFVQRSVLFCFLFFFSVRDSKKYLKIDFSRYSFVSCTWAQFFPPAALLLHTKLDKVWLGILRKNKNAFESLLDSQPQVQKDFLLFSKGGVRSAGSFHKILWRNLCTTRANQSCKREKICDIDFCCGLSL